MAAPVLVRRRWPLVLLVLGRRPPVLDPDRRALDRANRPRQAEQDRSERLLHSVLPGPIAARLKQSEQRIADGFPEGIDAGPVVAGVIGRRRFSFERRGGRSPRTRSRTGR